MTNEDFRAICRAACYALNIERPDALFDGDDVFLNGVKLGVFHDVELDDAIHCYLDIGCVESSPDAVSMLQEVLAINLELDAGLGEPVGMERKSGHLVLHALVPGADEHALASRLRAYVELVKELYGGVLSRITRPTSWVRNEALYA